MEELGAAIRELQIKVEATPQGDPTRAPILTDLGKLFCSRHQQTGDRSDLEASITHFEAAVEATPEGHPDRATRLDNLGIHLHNRYYQSENPEDLGAYRPVRGSTGGTTAGPYFPSNDAVPPWELFEQQI